MKYSKKDINHAPFIEELRARCIPHWDVAQNNIGADVIVFDKGKTIFVEIKNGHTKSAQKLTDNEQEFKKTCDIGGGCYIIAVDYEDYDSKI